MFGGKYVILHLEMDKKTVTFIVNPISGARSKQHLPGMIGRRIDSALFDCRIVETQYAGHATALARECAERGDDAVVAVGGDGTVNEVARALVHTQSALGIVPCGSGNGLARHLQIPLDWGKAIELVARHNVEAFDYGVINQKPFFCTCGMGFDAFISLKFAAAGRRGPITYVENVLREGLGYKPQTYTIEDETGTKRYKAFLIACANASQYGNNAYIAPKASMTDGLLDVVIMEPFDVLDAPQVSLDLFNRTLDKNSKIKQFRAKRIHILREQPGAIHYDGDPAEDGTDIDIHIEPLGIRIITDPDAREGDGQPTAFLGAITALSANLNSIRYDIERQGRKIQALNKQLLQKLAKI